MLMISNDLKKRTERVQKEKKGLYGDFTAGRAFVKSPNLVFYNF
jgi:hypothetical protein